MLKSMTGYGRAEKLAASRKFLVEVQSVNRKFLEVNLSCAKDYARYEHEITKLVMRYTSRGRISVCIKEEVSDISDPCLLYNVQAAEKYVGVLRSLAKKFKLTGGVTLDSVVQFKDIFQTNGSCCNGNDILAPLLETIDEALSCWQAMRKTEGAALQQDISSRIKTIEESVSKMETLAPRAGGLFKQRLEKLLEGLEDLEIQEKEHLILKEVALYAEKVDFTEEVQRLRSHLAQFEGFILAEQPAGKTLEFILQEMNREANTIGSKSSDLEVTRLVICVKSELEKIREQIQNVE